MHATDLHISRNLFYMFARITDCEFIASFVVIIFEITKTLIRQYPILFGRQVIKADTDITINILRKKSSHAIQKINGDVMIRILHSLSSVWTRAANSSSFFDHGTFTSITMRDMRRHFEDAGFRGCQL